MVYAPASGAALRIGWLVATSTVCVQRPAFIMPTPSDDGQMRPLISFICHAWCDAPSAEPLSRTMSTHLPPLSRQYAQPSSEPATNRVVRS